MGRRIFTCMRAAIALVVSGFLGAGFVSCGSNDPGVTYPFQMAVSGIDQQDGVFDAAPAEDGTGRIWMSYSNVTASSLGYSLPLINTRVASTDDGGATWTDAGLVNTSELVMLPDGHSAVWEHEVSRLIYDPSDTDPNRHWKILWHRYLNYCLDVNPTAACSNSARLFQHGWIGLKTAPAATGPWSPSPVETKLFVGSGYDHSNDLSTGSPVYQLDQLATGHNACLAFTEPGVLAASDGLYISLKCATSGSGKIVQLKCDHDFFPCSYLGDLISDTEASNYGAYDGFSASELVQSGGQTYLIATPTAADVYQGCLVFTIENLTTTPSLKRTDGVADVKLTVSGSSGSFNGACGYTAGLTQSGILYSEFFPWANA